MLSVVTDGDSTQSGSPIDESVWEGARRLLAAALEAKVNQYIAELTADIDDHGRHLVVRNGHHKATTVVTAAGPVEVKAPRVNDRRVDDATGERERFSSRILAPWCRKSRRIYEVLPLLYLHGLPPGDFVPTLEQFPGGTASLSPATVTRLTKQWSEDHAAFRTRDLSDRDFVYVWADGVHPQVRLGQAHSCVLVLLGVLRLDGTKELIALAEGLRESTEPWADLLRDCRRHGVRDPELSIGDDVMGLWRALAEVFPAMRPQRCWVHRSRNVTNCLPKAQPGVTKAMQESYNAESRTHAEKAIEASAKTYGAKFSKAVAKITEDWDQLLAFYDFPAEHWIHLRTTNPIESAFSTVKLRTKVIRGAEGLAAALAMVFERVGSGQARWRAITGAHLVLLVRAGARFENGILVERSEVAA